MVKLAKYLLLLSIVTFWTLETSDIRAQTSPPVAGFTSDKQIGTVPLVVNFIDQSIGEGLNKWDWTFKQRGNGTSFTSTERNPSIRFPSVTKIDVSLRVSNSAGTDSITKLEYIEVLPLPPVAGFSANTTSGNAPLGVTFTSNSTGSIDKYLYEFGDGTTDNISTTNHVYVSEGEYVPSLTVTGPGGSDTKIASFKIVVKKATPAPIPNTTSIPVPNQTPISSEPNNTLSADVVFNGQGAGDWFGSSVSTAGDFNGDGVDDVIIGAMGDDNSGNFSGSAFIFYGGTLNTDDADVTINGRDSFDGLGNSVSTAGDFNGDGIDDVIIGADGDNTTGDKSSITIQGNTGSSYIFFGNKRGVLNAGTDADVIINGGIKPVGNIGEGFGKSVSTAGDFNGDGLNDVIIGASGNSTEGAVSDKAYLFFGGKTGTFNSSEADLILVGQDFGDGFGRSVSTAGDFNGDGVGDVIVGATGDDNTQVNSGSAFIFFGGKTGTFSADDADVILNGQSDSDSFGIAVSTAGDFNGDGLGDVIVGAYFDDNNGESSGSAFIFFGGKTGTLGPANSSADVILNGQNTFDNFGSSVSKIGDVNADGIDDVIVGAAGVEKAYVFFGGKTGIFNADDADIILNGQSNSKSFGISFSPAGDFNRDGIDDFIVGDRQHENGFKSGSALIYFGAQSGTTAVPTAIPAPTPITMNKPVAEFEAKPTSGEVPLLVQFTDKSSNNPDTWFYDFGDGSTVAEQNPVHLYTEQGIFTVSLTVANFIGSDKKEKKSLINVKAKSTPNIPEQTPFPTSTPGIFEQTPFPISTPAPGSGGCVVPTADFIASSVQGKIPLTVNFTDISEGNPTEWLWDFGDGGMSISKNPAHKYELIGQYTVSLKVTNECGEDEEVKTDFINALPIKSFTFKCGKEFLIGAKELETLVMELGLNEQCKLKLTNLEPGVLVDVDTLIRSGFRSSIIAHPVRSTTDADGELEITITAVNKGIDWVAWSVRNEEGDFEYSKNAYNEGTAWGMFVDVK